MRLADDEIAEHLDTGHCLQLFGIDEIGVELNRIGLAEQLHQPVVFLVVVRPIAGPKSMVSVPSVFVKVPIVLPFEISALPLTVKKPLGSLVMPKESSALAPPWRDKVNVVPAQFSNPCDGLAISGSYTVALRSLSSSEG